MTAVTAPSSRNAGGPAGKRHMPMRTVLAGLLLAAAGGVSDTANADPYRWCASYTGHLSGTHCQFVTLEQCRASVFGVGGYCVPNPRTVAEQPAPARRKKRS